MKFFADILDDHYDELEFLWAQRRNFVRSPERMLFNLADIEGRIEAHVQGLLVADDELLPRLQGKLTAENRNQVFAGAYPLLRLLRDDAAQAVWQAFSKAEGPQREGLCEALSQAMPASLLPLARTALNSPLGVHVARVLAFQSPNELTPVHCQNLVKNDDPQLRRVAWSVVGLRGIALPQPIVQAGLNDADVNVRREALWSAAWCGQTWLLDHCRQRAQDPGPGHWNEILILATLGVPQDLERLRKVGQSAVLGPRRFLALGTFGHPALVDLLVEGMAGTDLLGKVAASMAFTKITGCDVASGTRVPVPPVDGKEPDDFEKEFLDEVVLPDVDKARAYWSKMGPQYSVGTRWGRGLDLSKDGGTERVSELDLEARWEVRLRGKFKGTWPGTRADLERFPNR